MKRMYFGILAYGKAPIVRQKLQIAITKCHLGLQIPVIKFEKHPRQQFYVFLGTDDAPDESSKDLINSVMQMSGVSNQLIGWVSESEIRGMATGDIETDVIGGLRSFYESKWNSFAGDPFTSLESNNETTISPEVDKSDQFDRLLYWLSATGVGTWSKFANACDAIGLIDDNCNARQVLRRMILLGHIECSIDGKRWSTCPPVLVQNIGDPSEWFLCGRRNLKTLYFLKDNFDILIHNQPQHDGPYRISIFSNADELSILETTDSVEHFKIIDQAALKIANILPDKLNYLDLLREIDSVTPAFLNFHYWNGESFTDPPEPVFRKGDGYSGRAGFYQITNKSHQDNFKMNLLLDKSGKKHRWLKGDWYGLRFLSMALNNNDEIEKPSAHWRQRDMKLAISPINRWPMIYERSLIISTGYLPQINRDLNWLIYNGISEELKDRFSYLLDVDIKELE